MMQELNEIRIGESIVGLKDNLVKSSILPKGTAELERDVNLQGNVIIEGAVYARNLIIDTGPARFNGAVYAHNELHVKNDSKDTVFFNKAVATSGSVVSLLTSGTCIYGSDINGGIIKLKNCFVAGSVFGNEIQLENTIVLGGCFAARKLTLQNVVTGTFNSPEVMAGGVNYLLYPTAFSVEPMSCLPGTEFYNITLADLGSLYKNVPVKPNTGKIRLDLHADSQRTVLVDESDTRMLLHSYSVAGRVLVSDLVDIDSLENHFLIISASLGSQILKTYSLRKEDGGESAGLTAENIAGFFFKILNGTVSINEINGSISFDELKQKYL
jgi:hypothetical protein